MTCCLNYCLIGGPSDLSAFFYHRDEARELPDAMMVRREPCFERIMVPGGSQASRPDRVLQAQGIV